MDKNNNHQLHLMSLASLAIEQWEKKHLMGAQETYNQIKEYLRDKNDIVEIDNYLVIALYVPQLLKVMIEAKFPVARLVNNHPEHLGWLLDEDACKWMAKNNPGALLDIVKNGIPMEAIEWRRKNENLENLIRCYPAKTAELFKICVEKYRAMTNKEWTVAIKNVFAALRENNLLTKNDRGLIDRLIEHNFTDEEINDLENFRNRLLGSRCGAREKF